MISATTDAGVDAICTEVGVKNLTMSHLDPGSQSIPFCTATMVAISKLYQNYCKVIMNIEELCI